MRSSLFALALILVLIVAGSAWADPFPIGAGKMPIPLGQVQVAIAREDLLIDVGLRQMRVQVDLWLDTNGTGGDIQVAFPCSQSEYSLLGPYCDAKFEVQVQGKAVEVSQSKVAGLGRAWLWSISMPGSGQVQASIRYTVEIQHPNWEPPLMGTKVIYYQLTTGSRWAGSIRELNMKVRLPVDAVIHIAPAGYERSRGEITWKPTDHEPDQDLVVVLDFEVNYIFLKRCQFGKPANKGGGNCAASKDRKELEGVIRFMENRLDRVTSAHSSKDYRFPMPTLEQTRQTYKRSAELLRELMTASNPAAAPKNP